MASQEGADDGGVFATLGFMDGAGVGEDEVFEGFFLIFDAFSVEIDEDADVGGLFDDADVAVEDVEVVIVSDLHDAVADAESFDVSIDGFAVWIELCLKDLVDVFDAAGILAHGAEDLDIGHGVESETFREFIADELFDESFGMFWGVGGE